MTTTYLLDSMPPSIIHPLPSWGGGGGGGGEVPAQGFISYACPPMCITQAVCSSDYDRSRQASV